MKVKVEELFPPLCNAWPHPPPHISVHPQMTMYMELKEIPHWSYKQMAPLWLSLSVMNKLRIDLLLMFLHLLRQLVCLVCLQELTTYEKRNGVLWNLAQCREAPNELNISMRFQLIIPRSVFLLIHSSQFPHEHINCLYLCTSLLQPHITEDLAIVDDTAFKLVATGDYVVCEVCKRLGKSLHDWLKIERIKQNQEEYFGKISDDRVVTMVLNPILLCKEFEEMNDLDNYSGSILEDRGKSYWRRYFLP